MEESSRKRQDSFHFRSQMYYKNERDRLILPHEVRSIIYAYAFAGKGEHSLKLFKILPTVCRFVYVEITTFINRDHFQLYFRRPLPLHTCHKRLDMTRSPVLKRQLNLRRLRCVILDLDRRSNVEPKHPLLVLPKLRQRLYEFGCVPQATYDPVDLKIWCDRHISKPDGRKPTEWADALTQLLDNYEVRKLVIRIG
jgi:hypothetical protein